MTVNSNVQYGIIVAELTDVVPRRMPTHPNLYVGVTTMDLDKRFLEHTNRARNGKTKLYLSVVANHGKRLRMDLAPGVKYLDKDSSKKAEAAWAEHLRSLGYIVKGGH